MDNESNNKNTEDQNSTDVENAAVENHVEYVTTDEVYESNEGTTNPNNKSSAGLSLWLSLLAIVGVAFLYYLHWTANSAGADSAVSADVIQQLQDSDQVLKTDLNNAQVDFNRVKQQAKQITAIEKQMDELSKQLSTLKNTGNQPSTTQFDNSDNESLLAQLQQQLAQQNKAITALQSAATNNTIQGLGNDVMTGNFNQIEKNTAIQVLLSVDVLLNTHRLPQAITALDNYLKISRLKPLDKNKVLQLLNQLQQVEQPDLSTIKNQLKALNTAVQELQLSTQDLIDEEPQWYERFVSVKKIETESKISSTAQMVTFKTELSRLLYQAQLYLMLKDQSGWKNSLNSAAQWVKAELPENEPLFDQIKNLSKQTVIAAVPDDLNVAAVIEDLNGQR